MDGDGAPERHLHRAAAALPADFAERRRAGAALFGAETYRRLQAVKAWYDPEDLIHANHAVQPSFQG